MGATEAAVPRDSQRLFVSGQMADLLEELDALFNNIVRHWPDRLDACFGDMRTQASPIQRAWPPLLPEDLPGPRNAGVSRPPPLVLPPPAPVTDGLAADTLSEGVAGPGPEAVPDSFGAAEAAPLPTVGAEVTSTQGSRRFERPQRSKAEVMTRYVEIRGSLGNGQAITPADHRFLLDMRDFFAQLVVPATVESILVSDGYEAGLMYRARRPGRVAEFDAFVGPIFSDPKRWLARGKPMGNHQHPDFEAGWHLSRRVAFVRLFALLAVLSTLLVSIFVFAGKTMVDDYTALMQTLSSNETDIARDIERRGSSGAQPVPRLFDLSLAYCDQPYLADDGVVRFVNDEQRRNCERLWGINRSVNLNEQQMLFWGQSLIARSFRWMFRHQAPNQEPPQRAPKDADAPAVPEGQTKPVPENERGLYGHGSTMMPSTRPLSFPEHARRISREEAFQLALLRLCQAATARIATSSTQSARAVDPAPAQDPPTPRPETANVFDCPNGGALPRDSVEHERDRIVESASREFIRLHPELKWRPELPPNVSRLNVRVVIEGMTLYVLPVLFAMLGALAAVLRRIRRRASSALLMRSEFARTPMTVLLGVVFGAVVSLLAEILRPSGGSSAAQVSLTLWPLAFLAGYAVEAVFRALDGAVDRVFGPGSSPDSIAPPPRTPV